jgi:hypothetical protein
MKRDMKSKIQMSLKTKKELIVSITQYRVDQSKSTILLHLIFLQYKFMQFMLRVIFLEAMKNTESKVNTHKYEKCTATVLSLLWYQRLSLVHVLMVYSLIVYWGTEIAQ